MACALGLQPAHSASRNGGRVQFHSAALLACKSWRSCGPHCERQRDRQSAWRCRSVHCPNCRYQAAAKSLAGYRYFRDRACGLHLLPSHRRLARSSDDRAHFCRGHGDFSRYGRVRWADGQDAHFDGPVQGRCMDTGRSAGRWRTQRSDGPMVGCANAASSGWLLFRGFDCRPRIYSVHHS